MFFSSKGNYMGLYDRDYTQADFQSQNRYAPRRHIGLPRLTPVVKSLLIVNAGIFLLCFVMTPLANFLFYWFSVFPESVGMSLQLWRLITYQFLHDTSDFRHIFINMLVLYFFGIILEQLWGSKKFLTFYLICGAMGGILYPILAHIGWLAKGPLIGASGAILGIIAACAVMFPNLRVFVLGIFPMRLVVLALIIAAISILTLLRPDRLANAGGEAAHLAGMVAGVAYVLSESWRAKLRTKVRTDRWKRKMTERRSIHAQLDQILEKVHNQGVHSLTRKQKRVLKQATEAERRRNKL